MSDVYTPEAWRRECVDAASGELFYWLTVYANGNPLGWTDEQIRILRDEIERRRAK